MSEVEIIDLSLTNLDDKGLFCVSNTKHEGFKIKSEWLKKTLSSKLVRLRSIISTSDMMIYRI
jgi:hypothetical protein